MIEQPNPLSDAEKDIFDRYVLEFQVHSEYSNAKSDARAAVALGVAAVGLAGGFVYLDHMQNMAAEITKWPTLFSAGASLGIGALAGYATAKEYVSYRHHKKLAHNRDY